MAGPVECVARRRVQSRLTDTVLKLQEELSNELDLQIKVAEKPSVWELLRVRFIRLPDIIIKLLVWYISRVWRYIRDENTRKKIWGREGHGRSRILRTTLHVQVGSRLIMGWSGYDSLIIS
ncbi:hypothetical protein HID58_085777, partial [Brassica napus]